MDAKQDCYIILRLSRPNNMQFTYPHFSWAGCYIRVNHSAHSFNRNWQLPFSRHQMEENDCRKKIMINIHETMLHTRQVPNPRHPDRQSESHLREIPGPATPTLGGHILFEVFLSVLVWHFLVCKVSFEPLRTVRDVRPQGIYILSTRF